MTTSSEAPANPTPYSSQGEAGRADNPSGRSRPAAGTQTRRPGGGGGGGGRAGGGRRPWGRRKVCQFCVDHVNYIDYKSVSRIRRYISERSRMESSKRTGTCTRHQRMLRSAILRARHMALLPYAPNHNRVTAAVQVAAPVADTPPDAEDSEAPAAGDEPEAVPESAEESAPEDNAEEAVAETPEAPEADEPEESADEDAEGDEPEESAEEDADDGVSEEPDDAKSGESDDDGGDVKQDEDDEDETSS